MKKFYILLFLAGFILAMGTSGTVDLGVAVISDTQLHIQLFASIAFTIIGSLGTIYCKSKEKEGWQDEQTSVRQAKSSRTVSRPTNKGAA